MPRENAAARNPSLSASINLCSQLSFLTSVGFTAEHKGQSGSAGAGKAMGSVCVPMLRVALLMGSEDIPPIRS